MALTTPSMTNAAPTRCASCRNGSRSAVCAHRAVPDVQLTAVAVNLQFVQLAFAVRRLCYEGRMTRFDETGEVVSLAGALDLRRRFVTHSQAAMKFKSLNPW